MFNYINNYANYRKSAFKDYAKHEIHKNNHLKVSLKDRNKSEELKKLEKENKEKHIKEIKQLEKRAETLFDYLNLKYRLSEREIKVVVMYYGLDGHEKRGLSPGPGGALSGVLGRGWRHYRERGRSPDTDRLCAAAF